MKKKAVSQSLINSVKKLDKINNIDFNFDGNLRKIIENPEKWAEEQAERAIAENTEKYLDAKELGEKFWDEVKNIS
jgi:hypothetical protein